MKHAKPLNKLTIPNALANLVFPTISVKYGVPVKFLTANFYYYLNILVLKLHT